jgi:hypothetical protein
MNVIVLLIAVLTVYTVLAKCNEEWLSIALFKLQGRLKCALKKRMICSKEIHNTLSIS